MERNIKELLIILKDELRKSKVFHRKRWGLCALMSKLNSNDKINDSEYIELHNYIYYNMPFYKYHWGWEPGVKAGRLEWLTEEINKL